MMLRKMLTDAARSLWCRGQLLMLAAMLVCAAMAPVMAWADDAPEPYDARMLGYPGNVQLDGGSTALTWIVLVLLGILTVAVLFKDAKRTHLD
jgi:hypothetical protein